MANYVYLNGVIVDEATAFAGGGGGGGGGGGLVQFILDSVTQSVVEDTATPANTKPLPVKVIETVNRSVVDFTPALIDASITNIPASASPPFGIHVLAADIVKIQVIEDIGEFMALYDDAAGTSRICNLPLGGGVVEVVRPAGTVIYIRSLFNTAITSGTLVMNFVG